MNLKLTVFLICFLSGSSAFAGSFYIGGGVGVSSVDDRVETSSAATFDVVTQLPTTLSLNGSQFDSSETLGGIVVGWNATDWLAIELGYADLGQFAQPQAAIAFLTTPISFPPRGLFPGIAAIPTLPQLPPSIAADLDVHEWSLGVRFSKPLFSNWSANWSVGISHAEFDTDGELSFNRVVVIDPLEFESITLQFETPENEIGFNYGFGFEWDFNDRFSTGIGYRKHDTRAVEVESLALRFTVNL